MPDRRLLLSLLAAPYPLVTSYSGFLYASVSGPAGADLVRAASMGIRSSSESSQSPFHASASNQAVAFGLIVAVTYVSSSL